jgi:hypothetical protein
VRVTVLLLCTVTAPDEATARQQANRVLFDRTEPAIPGRGGEGRRGQEGQGECEVLVRGDEVIE